MSRILFLDVAATTDKLEPVTEFLLFRYGSNETTQGRITLDETAARKVMAAYEKRTRARSGYLDIDFYHLSRKSDARLEDRRSAGRCKLELRDDGIWCTDIRPTAEARAMLEADQVRSYSPVVSVNSKGILLEVLQLSLTNIPAMDDAGLLAAEEDLDDALLLSVTPFQSLPVYEGETWEGKAADERVRKFYSSDGSGDLSKTDMARYRRAFVFFDGEAPEAISRYKGQVLDVQDIGNGPELVVSKRAVQTLGAIMQGSRGGINVSDSDREKGKAVLARYYKLFGAVAPWDRQEKQMGEMTTPRVELQLEAAQWANEMRDMLRKAVGYRFGEHAYIDDWSAEKVRVCVYNEDRPLTQMFEIPYTIDAGRILLGEPVEVRVSYVPVAAAAETMAMQERLSAAHTRLLELTGKSSTSEALVMLEALARSAAKTGMLEARLATLEEDRFSVARAAQLDAAKRAGKWTLALEQQGDRLAGMAQRLNEDRVKALETHWGAASVVIAPGGERQAQHQISLSEAEESTAQQVAKLTGKPVEAVRKTMLEQKARN